jgi:hypothetical protein
MRRTCPSVPRSPFAILLMLLAASCGDGGGDGDLVAAPHELSLTIVRGKGMHVPVRPVDAPAGEAVPSDEPVVVEVSALIGANRQASAGATGPSQAVQLPPVELRWRSLHNWCKPLHATTPLTRGDTVHNHYVRPTLADACYMVVEGVSNGWVFDTDTAFVIFDPGPIVSLRISQRAWLVTGRERGRADYVYDAEDAYGNEVPNPPSTWTITARPDLFVLTDTAIVAKGEGVGAAQVTVGPFSQQVVLWGFSDLQGPLFNPPLWRLSWGCNDVPLPGGGRADSVRFAVDSAVNRRGSSTPTGWTTSWTGRAVVREWRPGEPVRQSTLAGYAVTGSMRPLEIEWSPGQVAQRTATGYAGASLCEQTYLEPVGGFVPVRVDTQ